jgi:hypothetical protein
LKLNRYSLPVIVASLLAALLFFFRLPVSRLLYVLLVRPLFADVEAGIWTDLVLYAVLLLLAYWTAKSQARIFLYRLVLYGLVFYVLQRTNSYWVFYRLSTFDELVYWDLFAITLLLLLPLSYVLKEESNHSATANNEGFIEDNAVTDVEDDHFRRSIAAKEIARLVKLTHNKKSFAIGILGEYGSGKTSFLNLIHGELSRNDVLKIAFDPWSAGSPETIRREFFDLLASKVAEVDLSVSALIYSYGRRLAGFDARSLSLLNWLGFLGNKGSVQSSGEYQRINQMISSTGRKIVITIDDLDRLHPAEIMEVLKLIRNTANFSNVFYLVGYDKGYVQGAIKTLNDAGSLNYLDKIFQLEIPLPKREEDDLLVTLQERLKEMVTTEHYAVFENIMIPNGFRSRYEKAYSGVLRQGRDVVRFINGFKIIYKLIGEEVDFECLVLLELIKFRFPAIYELLYVQHDVFLYEQPLRSSHQQYYSPVMVKAEGSTKRSDEVSLFKTHIEKLGWLSPEEVSLLDGLFMALFKGSLYHHRDSKNSISYPLYFEIYFRYRLSQRDLSDKDFKAALASGHMREYMDYCASHGLHKELMVRLMQENINKDRRHFEQVIRWIFAFGRTYVQKESKFSFDYEALVDKIYNYHNNTTDKLYKKDVDAYKRFIDHLFGTAIAPFLFENELLYHLKKKGEGFVISLNEMTVHQYSYFTQMADSGHGLSEDTLWLFYGAREHHRVPADERGAYYEKWRFEPSLANKMKQYLADKDPKEFLKFSIQQDMRDRSQAFIHREVMEMFYAPAEYRSLVAENQALDDEIQKEYLELFDKLAETNFQQYAEIDLKTELHKPERG